MIRGMALHDVDLLPAREPPPGPISYEAFLEWADDQTHAEWVDGQVILLHVTVAERHARVVLFLNWLFAQVSQFGRLGRALGEPFQMWLPEQRRGRAPDLFFVLPERLHLLDRHYFRGGADLVVEVISPESAHRDRVDKLAEYEQARVREYWLIDAEELRAELRVLGPDGRYRLAFAGSTGLYQSTVLPSLRLRVDWLWQVPGPDMGEVLRVLSERTSS
jgi:Uma2 family endonuclease